MKDSRILKVPSNSLKPVQGKKIILKRQSATSSYPDTSGALTVTQTTPNTRSLTSTVQPVESQWGDSQKDLKAETQTISNPALTAVEPMESSTSSTPIQTDVVFDNKQLTQAILDLNNKLDSALNAKATIDTAQPEKPSGPLGIVQMIMDLANNYAPIIQKALSGTGNDSTVQMIEEMKNQLLFQKLGLLNPATPPKVSIE
jgi:hypothetical protein